LCFHPTDWGYELSNHAVIVESMIHSRSTYGESSPNTVAQSPVATPPPRNQFDDAAPSPRWGLLAAAIVAALLTASWIGSTLSTADTEMPPVRSAQALGK